jgi:hypothetical protein
MSRRHNNAVGTGNFSYFFEKNEFLKKSKKIVIFIFFSLIFFKIPLMTLKR